MNLCKTCVHWRPWSEDQCKRLGVSNGTDGGKLFGSCNKCKHGCPQSCIEGSEDCLFTISDGEGYQNDLTSREDFGCICWEPKGNSGSNCPHEHYGHCGGEQCNDCDFSKTEEKKVSDCPTARVVGELLGIGNGIHTGCISISSNLIHLQDVEISRDESGEVAGARKVLATTNQEGAISGEGITGKIDNAGKYSVNVTGQTDDTNIYISYTYKYDLPNN